ncbi:MAG: radical SAM protein [Thermodesulfobacteriota bacterium]
MWSIVAAYRRLLAREQGTVVKDWGGRIPVALVFPNVYHAGMSNLGFQAVYGLFNSYPDVVCERAFVPDPALAREYVRTGAPLLSLETQRPLYEFELVAFSLTYENDYPAVVSLLELARLAPRREARDAGDPLILAGGITMRTNPEPLADFLDLVLLGEAEAILPALLEAWRETRSYPLPKNDRVLHLALRTPGAYAPALYEAALDGEGRLASFQPRRPELPSRIKVARAQGLPHPALTTQVLTAATEFAATKLVEIGRGCPHGCRFCAAGFVYRPPRFQTRAAIQAALGPPSASAERVGLISPSAADHPELAVIVRDLTDQGREVTVSSLRVESLNPELLAALALGGLRGAAIAPEAGSERLRRFVNKRISDTQIIEGAADLARAGLRKIKLYFLLGLPTETRDDVQAALELTRRIIERLDGLAGVKARPEIILSLGSFVPKPFTPLAAQPMAEQKELKARAGVLRGGLKRERGVRVHFDPPKWAYLQTLFSRGDRRAGTIVEALARHGRLAEALKQAPFDPDFYVRRNMEDDRLWPWSFIDHGFEPDFLSEELAGARSLVTTPACRPESCRRCGVCPGRNEAA